MKRRPVPIIVRLHLAAVLVCGASIPTRSQGDSQSLGEPPRLGNPSSLTDSTPYTWPLLHELESIQGPTSTMPAGEWSDRLLPYRLLHVSSAKIFKEDDVIKDTQLAYAKAAARREAFNQRFESIIVPKITFANCSLDTALAYLKRQAEESTGNALSVNLVSLLPPGAAESRRVSLDVRNIPFLDALHYVCEQSGASFSLETYAIVITDLADPQPTYDRDTFAGAEEPIAYLSIPRIALDHASLGDSLEQLKAEVRTISAGAMPANIVTHLPEDAKPAAVTLDLADIPFREALLYICLQAGVKFEADPYAMMIADIETPPSIQNGAVLRGATVDARISSMLIPELKIEHASLSAALDILKDRAAELPGGTAPINFVLQDQGDSDAKPVTLDVSNVPFFAALRYICFQADAKFTVDKYATVISRVNLPPVAQK